MPALTRQTIKKAIAPAIAIAFVCLGCLGSILYVNESNPSLSENNHWPRLDQEETKYADIAKLVLDPAAKTIPETSCTRARELAMIYRQQGKQEKAAEIFRKLWISNQSTSAFSADARELASIYTDMAAFPSAVETYQQILQYDRAHLPPNDPGIARDVNNLGQCYYTAACGTAEPKLRRQYLLWAREQLETAGKINALSHSTPQEKANQTIIELNKKLVEVDLDLQS